MAAIAELAIFALFLLFMVQLTIGEGRGTKDGQLKLINDGRVS